MLHHQKWICTDVFLREAFGWRCAEREWLVCVVLSSNGSTIFLDAEAKRRLTDNSINLGIKQASTALCGMSSMSWAIQAGTGWTMEHNILWSLSHLVTDNFDLTETTATLTWLRWKQLLACYLFLLTVVIPMLPIYPSPSWYENWSQAFHSTVSASSREWAWRTGLLATRGYYWVEPNILLLFTIAPHLKHGCCSFFHGGCDIGLDFDLA